MYILLKKNISAEELIEADEMLTSFVTRTENYFTESEKTFNIHQLLHVAESVQNWGPLWAHSCFGFEAANHNCLRAIKSAKGVNVQILRFMMMQSTVHALEQYLKSEYPELGLDSYDKFLCEKKKYKASWRFNLLWSRSLH